MSKLEKYADYWKNWLTSGKVGRDIVDTVVCFAKAYLMAIMAMMVFQRYLMYQPSASWVVNPVEHSIEIISYSTVDNVKLTSWYVPPKGDRPVFVMFHGNAGNISSRAFKLQYFADRGYGFLLAEYRGYGNNAGSPSEEGLYNDGRAAMTWLMKTRKIKQNKIIVYGESVGSGVASEMALEFKGIKALVLEAPFANVIDLAGDVYPWLGPFKYLTLDRYDNTSKAAYFESPVIVLHGSKDKVIPVKHGRALYDAFRSRIKKYVLLEGGGHNDLANFGLLQGIERFVGGL